MKNPTRFYKGIAFSFLAGAISMMVFVIYVLTDYQKLLLFVLDFSYPIYWAIFGFFLILALMSGLFFYLFFKAQKVRMIAIPIAFLLIIIFIAAPIVGISYINNRYIKGESHLDRITPLYTNLSQWESRANSIRQGILNATQLNPLPDRTPLNATIHSVRNYTNYSVANVYFQSLPGFYEAGNLYRPLDNQSILRPVVLLAQGHFENNRFNNDTQELAATLARMGAIVFLYDMVGRGESIQVSHSASNVMELQLWNSMRVIDFLLSLPDADPSRVAMTGASGGGTQTIIATAVDSRINVSAPVVMVSSWDYGGCSCEIGMPIHRYDGYATNNAEIAALAAPRPMLLVSDGHDWTFTMPVQDFPFIQRIYGFYNESSKVVNVHLPDDYHDYGVNKRNATYHFFAQTLNIAIQNVQYPNGSIDETENMRESDTVMRAFNDVYPFPPTALMGQDAVLQQLRLLQHLS